MADLQGTNAQLAADIADAGRVAVYQEIEVDSTTWFEPYRRPVTEWEKLHKGITGVIRIDDEIMGIDRIVDDTHMIVARGTD